MEPYSKVNLRSNRAKTWAAAQAVGPGAWQADVNPLPPYLYTTWTDYVDGFKNPLWKLQVIRGEGATTDFVATERVVKVEEGAFQVRYSWVPGAPEDARLKSAIVMGPLLAHMNIDLPMGVNGIHVGTADNDAAGDWYKKVRNRMSTFKGLTFAAESLEAKRMIFDRSTKMLTKIPIFQNLLRKRWVRSRTKRGKLRTLSNSWLELQYGWAPLVSDLEDANKVLQNPTPQYKYVKGEGNARSIEENSSDEGGQNDVFWDLTKRLSSRYYIKYYGVIQARADPSGSRLQDWGLTTREFLPTLWEVIPWSFAVDYFTNVSDIINAVSYASVGVRWVSRAQIWERTCTRRYVCRSTPPSYLPVYNVDFNIPSSVIVTSRKVVRTAKIGDIPIPSLQFQLPNWKQTLNLAALAVSRRLRLAY
jgi:hypothetical protein